MWSIFDIPSLPPIRRCFSHFSPQVSLHFPLRSNDLPFNHLNQSLCLKLTEKNLEIAVGKSVSWLIDPDHDQRIVDQLTLGSRKRQQLC